MSTMTLLFQKWPDYVFKYDYFNTTDEKAKLLPSRTASKKSFQFVSLTGFSRSPNLYVDIDIMPSF